MGVEAGLEEAGVELEAMGGVEEGAEAEEKGVGAVVGGKGRAVKKVIELSESVVR